MPKRPGGLCDGCEDMQNSNRQPARTGIVVIGRNEGGRLLACLDSLGEAVTRTVYVDSGSTDGLSLIHI